LRRRKDQNILELEVNEILTNNTTVIKGLEIDELIIIIIKGIILLEALNSLSFRFFSFFNLALLGLPDRIAKIF